MPGNIRGNLKKYEESGNVVTCEGEPVWVTQQHAWLWAGPKFRWVRIRKGLLPSYFAAAMGGPACLAQWETSHAYALMPTSWDPTMPQPRTSQVIRIEPSDP